VIIISFSRQNLTGWEKKKYAAILRKIILGFIQLNRNIKDMGNFINIEMHIRLNKEETNG